MERRDLHGGDLFKIMTLLSKLGIKQMVVTLIKQRELNITDSKKSIEETGIEIIGDIIDLVMVNASKAEKELNALICELYSISVEDIKKMDLIEYTQMIFGIFMADDFQRFLGVIFSSNKIMNTK